MRLASFLCLIFIIISECCNMEHFFDNCISLGWLCATAGSMAKYGLRSFSGPFDWYFSEYSGVIQQIKTGFSDFLKRENLDTRSDKPRRFFDKKYGFEYVHDIVTDLDKDYDEIYSKYKRRTDRFLNVIKKPTLFFRTVRDLTEKQYIIDNYILINGILKEYNNLNEVIYLYSGKIGCFPEYVRSFPLNIEDYKCDPASVRNLFDNSPELIGFCSKTISFKAKMNNLEFDSKCNDAIAADIYHLISEDNDQIWRNIMYLLGTGKNEGIFLWGAGYHGKAMLNYLKRKNVKINGLIDKAHAGQVLDTYQILSPESAKGDFKIFIAIADHRSVKSIRDKLKERFPDIKAVDYYDLRRLRTISPKS